MKPKATFAAVCCALTPAALGAIVPGPIGGGISVQAERRNVFGTPVGTVTDNYIWTDFGPFGGSRSVGASIQGGATAFASASVTGVASLDQVLMHMSGQSTTASGGLESAFVSLGGSCTYQFSLTEPGHLSLAATMTPVLVPLSAFVSMQVVLYDQTDFNNPVFLIQEIGPPGYPIVGEFDVPPGDYGLTYILTHQLGSEAATDMSWSANLNLTISTVPSPTWAAFVGVALLVRGTRNR